MKIGNTRIDIMSQTNDLVYNDVANKRVPRHKYEYYALYAKNKNVGTYRLLQQHITLEELMLYAKVSKIKHIVAYPRKTRYMRRMSYNWLCSDETIVVETKLQPRTQICTAKYNSDHSHTISWTVHAAILTASQKSYLEHKISAMMRYARLYK